MSGFIPGRQYRVTHTVTADNDGSLGCDLGTIVSQRDDSVTFELLPKPLPTGVDAVVMVVRDRPGGGSRQRLVLQYDADGHWHGTGGTRWTTAELQDESDGPLHGELVVLYNPAVEW